MTITPLSTKQTDTHCEICGHPSHCGGPTTMTVRDYSVDGGALREIQVCNHCSCDKCNEPEEINKEQKIIPNNKKF